MTYFKSNDQIRADLYNVRLHIPKIIGFSDIIYIAVVNCSIKFRFDIFLWTCEWLFAQHISYFIFIDAGVTWNTSYRNVVMLYELKAPGIASDPNIN